MGNIISADGHVLETENVWVERVSAKYRDFAPRPKKLDNGQWVLAIGDQTKGVAPGLGIEFMDQPGTYDPAVRLEIMDEQRIDAEALFGNWIFGLYGLGTKDPEFEVELVRGYNDWLAEFCRPAPDRLMGIGNLPVHDVSASIEEAKRIKSLGLKGACVPFSRPELHYNDPAFEPLWTALEENGLPLSLHVGLTLPHRGTGAFAANITYQLSSCRAVWPLFVFSGILDRHPNLKLVMTEGGVNWLPGTLMDMDWVYENLDQYLDPNYDRTTLQPDLSLRPSDYWRRQCYTTFQEDPIGMELLDRVGADTVLWGSDFPHPEGTHPNTTAMIEKAFKGVDPASVAAMVGGNAKKLWLSAA